MGTTELMPGRRQTETQFDSLSAVSLSGSCAFDAATSLPMQQVVEAQRSVSSRSTSVLNALPRVGVEPGRAGCDLGLDALVRTSHTVGGRRLPQIYGIAAIESKTPINAELARVMTQVSAFLSHLSHAMRVASDRAPDARPTLVLSSRDIRGREWLVALLSSNGYLVLVVHPFTDSRLFSPAYRDVLPELDATKPQVRGRARAPCRKRASHRHGVVTPLRAVRCQPLKSPRPRRAEHPAGYPAICRGFGWCSAGFVPADSRPARRFRPCRHSGCAH